MYNLENGIDQYCKKFAEDNDFIITTKKDFPSIPIQEYEQNILDNCKNKITREYVLKNYVKVINNDKDYDGIHIINKNNEICGFLFTKRLDCQDVKYKNLPILNLICSKGCTTKTKTSVSKLMMYIYLNSLLHHKLKYGTLELANGFNNPSGYCLYSKYGFIEDVELIYCVSGFCSRMLPMSVDMQKLSKSKLYDITFKDVNVFPKKFECRSENFSKEDKLSVIKKQRTKIIEDTIKSLKTYLFDRSNSLFDLVQMQNNMVDAMEKITNNSNSYNSNNDMPQLSCKVDKTMQKMRLIDFSKPPLKTIDKITKKVDKLKINYDYIPSVKSNTIKKSRKSNKSSESDSNSDSNSSSNNNTIRTFNIRTKTRRKVKSKK